MKVTRQQPAPVPPSSVGRAEAAAAPAGPGKLQTGKGEYQARLGAPADLPAPERSTPGPGVRAADLNAAIVTPQPMPSPDEVTADESHSRHYSSDRLYPDGTQPHPSGSLSRVSARGSAPGSPAPGAPHENREEQGITTRLSQLSGNKAFFQRHGIEAPRGNIRIPVLKLSIIRRDSDYKAMITRLDSALSSYRQALTGAGAINAQTMEQRSRTMVTLDAQLDRLESSIVTEQRALSAADPKFGQKQALLGALAGVVDDERAMLVDVFNAHTVADQGNSGHPVPWQHALEFKRVGLNAGSNVQTGDSQGKVVKSFKRFGAGAFNTVSRLKFRDGSEGIFKPGVTHEDIANRPCVAHCWNIPREQPRYEARNIASTNLDKLLDTGVLVKSEFFVHNNELGILMEKAPGQSAFATCVQGDDRVVEKLLHNPGLHRELNKLQIMDALCGQHDRHFSNLFVATDAKGQNVRVKGIDNDASFGQREPLNDPALFANRAFEAPGERSAKLKDLSRDDKRGMEASHNVGLPPLMDAGLAEKLLAPGFLQQAQASVKGLLSPTETERMSERIEAVQQHARYLKSCNLTVTDWDSGTADNGQPVHDILGDDPSHSYSVAFNSMADRYKQLRLLNNAMA